MSDVKKTIQIIGVPSDFGANVKGTLMGPNALRTVDVHSKLKTLGYQVVDEGDIVVPIRESLSPTEKAIHYLNVIYAVNNSLKAKVEFCMSNNRIPLVLGGDHSLAIGSISGVLQSNQSKKVGLVWVDTHADMNTPEISETQNIHGMPVSVLLGNGHAKLVSLFGGKSILPENIAMIGLRDVDRKEKNVLKSSGVHYYSMRDIDEKGIQRVYHEINENVFQNVDGVHVSFDVDVMDPLQLPGVSTPIPGGLTLREAHLLLELIFESGKVISADFVELNPMFDDKGRSARMTADLITSLFGKSVT